MDIEWGRACVRIYLWVCLCLFEYVGSCMVFILIRLHLNMWVYSIELCVSLRVSVSARVCRDTCLGITGNRAGMWSGDGCFQMPFCQRAGGAAYKWHVLNCGRQGVWGEIMVGVYVCERECVPGLLCANLQSWLCLCITNSCQLSFCTLCIWSNALLLSTLYLPARKYIFALSSSLFMMSISERVSKEVNKCQFTGWIALDFKARLLNPNPLSSFIKCIQFNLPKLVKKLEIT